MAVLVLMLIFREHLRKYSSQLTVIVSFVLSSTTLLYSIINMDQGSEALQFLRGWSFAIAQIVLVNQFPRLKFKILFMFVALGLRYGVMGYLNMSVFNVDIVIRNIVSDFFVMYVYYNSEKQEKAIFKDFFNYREELKKYKILIENYLPQSVIILDTKTQDPLFVNKAFPKLLEASTSGNERIPLDHEPKPASPLVATTLESLVPHTDSLKYVDKPQSTSCINIKAKNTGQFLKELMANDFFDSSAVAFTASYKTKDKQKTFEVVLMPLTWDTQDAVAVLLNDITEQEKTFVLKVADKNKDLVLATMSHELRTPLNGIIGIIQMIESKIDKKETADLLALCKDNATLLLSLVNSVLDLQQISHGKLKLHISTIDIRATLENTARLFQFQLEQKGLYLHIKVDENVPSNILTDVERLKHVLINIIGNAAKFTLRGGIRLEATQDPDDSKCIRISINDTGIGMREERMNALFKMYRKAEDPQGLSTHGVGLGLTISDNLVRVLNRNDSSERNRS